MRSFLLGIRHSLSVRGFVRRATTPLDGHHTAIMRGVVIVSLFAAFAKLIGTAKEFVVAWRFGTSEQIEAYIFVFNLYGVPVAIWVGAMGGVFIPRLVRLQNECPNQALLLQSEMNGVATLSGLIVGAVWAGLTIGLIKSGHSGLSPVVAEQAIDISRKIWPIIPALFLVQVGSSQLMASRLHVNTVYEGLPALALIVSIWAIRNPTNMALVVGTLAGVGIQLLATQYSVGRLSGTLKFRLGLSAPGWKELATGFWLLATAYALQGMSALFDQFVLARLGPGAIATFGYASRLLALVVSLGGIAISRTILPILSGIDKKDVTSFRRTTLIWVVVMFVAGAALFAAFGMFAEQIVRLVFEHGAFSARDSASVIELVWYLAQTLPFYFAMTVLVQAQLASEGHRTMILLSGLALVLKISFGLPLAWFYGVSGLAMANILVTGFQCAFLLYTFNKLGLARHSVIGKR